MGQVSPKLRSMGTGYAHWCPGCEELHYIRTTPPTDGRAPCWAFDGNVMCPTFSPSVLIKTGAAVQPGFVREEGDPPEVCHYFLIGGILQFCGDSTHALAGQHVPLPDLPEEHQD